MNPAVATVLAGLVQGVLEWLPVSSEGQVSVLLSMLGGAPPASAVSMALWLHLGTSLAAAAYLRSELAAAIRWLLRAEGGDPATFKYLLVGTAVTGVTGVPSYLLATRVPSSVALALVTPTLLTALGVALLLAEGRAVEGRPADPVKLGAIVGFLQGVAALPGVSRSGITVLGLMLMGLEAEGALKLSFLLSIPASLGAAGLVALTGAVDIGAAQVLSAAAAAGAGYASMHALMRLSKRVSPGVFAVSFGLMGLAVALAVISR